MQEEDIKKLFQLCNSTTEEEALKLDENRFQSNFKFDGENIMAIVIDNQVILGNRRGKICNLHFREVVEDLEKQKLGNCILNGEIISLNDDFNKLMQRAMTKTLSKIKIIEKTNPVKFMVFDILKNQEKDLRNEPLKIRLAEMQKLFENKQLTSVELAEFKLVKELLPIAKEKDKEGLIIKDMEAIYDCGRRTDNFLKLKFFLEGTIKAIKYDLNPKGLTLEDIDGNRVAVLGEQSKEVKDILDKNGEIEVCIQYLEKTADNRFRFPSYRGLVNKSGIVHRSS